MSTLKSLWICRVKVFVFVSSFETGGGLWIAFHCDGPAKVWRLLEDSVGKIKKWKKGRGIGGLGAGVGVMNILCTAHKNPNGISGLFFFFFFFLLVSGRHLSSLLFFHHLFVIYPHLLDCIFHFYVHVFMSTLLVSCVQIFNTTRCTSIKTFTVHFLFLFRFLFLLFSGLILFIYFIYFLLIFLLGWAHHQCPLTSIFLFTRIVACEAKTF